MAITLGAAAVQTSVGTSTTIAVTISATSGRSLLFALAYRDPGGTNPPTSVVSSGGETVTAVGSSDANSEGATRQFYVVPSVSATASRTITATFATGVYAAAIVWELVGADTSNIVDATNEEHGSYSGGGGTNPTMSLVTTAANSAIFAICDSSGVEPGVDTGYTLVDLPNYYQYCAAQYLLDAGAATTETVQMTAGSFTEWGLSAVAIRAYTVTPLADPSGVTAGTLTPEGATISWTDNSTGETGFEVETSPSPYSVWTAASNSPAAANATSLVVTGLTDGVTYKARVRAAGTNPSSWVETGAFLVPALTRLRPNADTTVGAWTASSGSDLYAMVDETTASDSDYITTSSTTTGKLKVENSTDPGSDNYHSVKIRARSTGGTLTVSLIQGHPSETVIKSWTPTLTSSFADYTLTMSSGEASAITDYASLYVKLVTS